LARRVADPGDQVKRRGPGALLSPRFSPMSRLAFVRPGAERRVWYCLWHCQI